MTLENDIGCLRALPLFKDLPASRLKLVALMGERLRFPAGNAMVGDAEKPDGVYVILEGEVEFSHSGEDGTGRKFQKEAGSIIGDVSLLSGQRFLGKVSAKSDVLALRIPRDLFFELLQTVPEFSLAICRDLASRVARLANVLLREDEAVS
jgi:CRP-like cAMP-binding protein